MLKRHYRTIPISVNVGSGSDSDPREWPAGSVSSPSKSLDHRNPSSEKGTGASFKGHEKTSDVVVLIKLFLTSRISKGVVALIVIGLSYGYFSSNRLEGYVDQYLASEVLHQHHNLQASEVDMGLVKHEFDPVYRPPPHSYPHKVVHALLLEDLVEAVWNDTLAWPPGQPNLLDPSKLATIRANQRLGVGVVAANVPVSRPLLPGRETLVLMTPTHPGHGGRNLLVRRHIASLWVALLAGGRLWSPGLMDAGAKQLLWVVVEDGPSIDDNILDLLLCSELPFVYFAYGPTHSWGHAQRNAAAMLASKLADLHSMEGPGFFMDDDVYISPWLFEKLLGIGQVSVWPLAGRGPLGWEGPILDPETQGISRWETGDDVPQDAGDGSAAARGRLFPLNWNSFAINTALLADRAIFQPGRSILDYTGDGGESELVSKVCDGWGCLDVLCDSCRLAWYQRQLNSTDLLWPECEPLAADV